MLAESQLNRSLRNHSRSSELHIFRAVKCFYPELCRQRPVIDGTIGTRSAGTVMRQTLHQDAAAVSVCGNGVEQTVDGGEPSEMSQTA